MNRFVALVCLFLLQALPQVVFSAEPAKRLNIILFLIDDLGWRDLGCQGSSYYQTPNIDRLAAEGSRFTDAYSACAVCSPTRAAILTGKYPARLLLTDWLPAGRWDPKSRLREGRFVRGLPVEELTLAEVLRDSGYKTANIGKWHLGSEPFSLPEHHGFDLNIAGNAHGAPGSYFFPYTGDWLIPSTGQRAKWNVLPNGQDGEYLTERLTDESIRFIQNHKEQPFFLYFPHYAVHTPLEAPESMIAEYAEIPKEQQQGKPVYAAMVESVDKSVGRIMTTLQELKLEEQTLIIFTSDNGGFYNATNNAPLRANKGAYYEGGIRVPLIIKWPGQSESGSVIREPVISTDLYPTCLAAAGLPLLPNQHIDGETLQTVIANPQHAWNRSLFWHYPHYNEHPSSVPSSVIRQGKWKLIESFDPEGIELYNLQDDLGETKNLAETEADITKKLRGELDAWRQQVRAEPMMPNPNYDPVQLPAKKKKKKSDS